MPKEKRQSISPSLRWSVFSRDGFCCRYCGCQAGQAGVELTVDHVVSVVEGGDNRIDNLITACRKCNGGKGAKSLMSAPTTAEVLDRTQKQRDVLLQQAAAMSASIGARKRMEKLAVKLKCEAYGVDQVSMANGEEAHIIKLCQAYGPDRVAEWYQIAAGRVRPRRAIQYVYGILRNLRKQEEHGA